MIEIIYFILTHHKYQKEHHKTLLTISIKYFIVIILIILNFKQIQSYITLLIKIIENITTKYNLLIGKLCGNYE